MAMLTQAQSRLTFGVLTSRDNAKNTLSKIPFSSISRFSSLYRSRLAARHPKKSQTFGTMNASLVDLISSSSCQKLRNGAVPVPVERQSHQYVNLISIIEINSISRLNVMAFITLTKPNSTVNSPGPMRMIGWVVSFGRWKFGALRTKIWISSFCSSPSR